MYFVRFMVYIMLTDLVLDMSHALTDIDWETTISLYDTD